MNVMSTRLWRAAVVPAGGLMAALWAGCAAGQHGPHDVKRGYAPVNGLRMYYEIHGLADRRRTPLVLLHGGGSTIETSFAKILPHLARTRQVIAFEQQGHGRTADIPERPFSFEQSADDAAGLLAHLQVERADLFGFSNGGNIAMQVAIRHPARVRKLVVASAMFRRDGLYPEMWEFMRKTTFEDMPRVLKEAYREVSPHPERLPSFFDKSVRRMLAFRDWPAEHIRSIRSPTLLLIGDADNVRPEHAVEMFRLLPRGRLAVIPGGHGAAIGEASAARIEDSQVRFGTEDSPAGNPSRLPELTAALVAEFLDEPMPGPD